MTSPSPIDVRDMAIIHQAFRRAYNESAALVRNAASASADRVGFLADHVDLGVALLHIHHDGEDELVYPKLMERRPEQAASTEQIRREHQDIQAQLNAVSEACKAWRAGPSTESGEALSSALEQLNASLQVHLDNEEEQVVPLAAITLTQKEWDEVGSRAVAQVTRKQRPIAFACCSSRSMRQTWRT